MFQIKTRPGPTNYLLYWFHSNLMGLSDKCRILPSAISPTPRHECKVLPSAISPTPGHEYKVLPSRTTFRVMQQDGSKLNLGVLFHDEDSCNIGIDKIVHVQCWTRKHKNTNKKISSCVKLTFVCQVEKKVQSCVKSGSASQKMYEMGTELLFNTRCMKIMIQYFHDRRTGGGFQSICTSNQT